VPSAPQPLGSEIPSPAGHLGRRSREQSMGKQKAALEFTADQELEAYRDMLLIRRFE
jgi:hypothetical protein